MVFEWLAVQARLWRSQVRRSQSAISLLGFFLVTAFATVAHATTLPSAGEAAATLPIPSAAPCPAPPPTADAQPPAPAPGAAERLTVPQSIVRRGSGVFVSQPPELPTSTTPHISAPGEPKLDIMFERAPVATVVQSLLGDVVGASVIIDPSVTGEITIHSQGQLTADEVPAFLKSALKAIGLDLIDQGHNAYLLQSEHRADSRASAPTVYRPGTDARSGLVIMGLRYVSAAEMLRLLQPLARSGVTVQAESTREMLIMNGPPDGVDAVVKTVELLDVDWLQGMSFGIVPLDYSDPDTLIDELKKLFGGPTGPIGTMVEFVPFRSRHAILILAKRPERLDEARSWIAQLDRPIRGQSGTLVIPLKYADAAELAEFVKKLYQASPSAPTSSPPAAGAGGGASSSSAGGDATSTPRGVQVTADPTHNALLIQADAGTQADIRATVEALDTPVPQVIIEVTIAEVTLNNDLRFGVQWAFDGRGGGTTVLTQGSSGSRAIVGPVGFGPGRLDA